MDGFERSPDSPNTERLVEESAPKTPGHRDLALKFESLGGSGHGSEFAVFQQNAGAQPNGLLA